MGFALLISSASVIGEKIMRSVPLRNYPHLSQGLKVSALYKRAKPQIYNFMGKILFLGKTGPLAAREPVLFYARDCVAYV